MTKTEKTIEAAAGFGPLETIFCATDFSPTAELALRHAESLARQHGARLVLGHVVEPMPVVPYPMLAVPADGELAVRKLAAEKLEAVVAGLTEGGLQAEGRMAGGAPGYELVELAKEVGANLFVIGTRGLTGFEHIVFGSTAEHVVRRASCPVLTVHPKDAPPSEKLETVILPSDLSEAANYAIGAFAEIFDGGIRPDVIVVFADQTPPYLEPFRHATLDRWDEPDLRKEDIEKRMAPTVSTLRDCGFDVELVVLDGEPVHAITELAAERAADMIVMSTHGRSALLNVLLGRTAQRVVHHAPCPVLTVRPPAKS